MGKTLYGSANGRHIAGQRLSYAIYSLRWDKFERSKEGSFNTNEKIIILVQLAQKFGRFTRKNLCKLLFILHIGPLLSVSFLARIKNDANQSRLSATFQEHVVFSRRFYFSFVCTYLQITMLVHYMDSYSYIYIHSASAIFSLSRSLPFSLLAFFLPFTTHQSSL